MERHGSTHRQQDAAEAPLMRSFKEELVRDLKEDFSYLKEELRSEIQAIKHELKEAGGSVDTLEGQQYVHKEEKGFFFKELLTFKELVENLQSLLEDGKTAPKDKTLELKERPCKQKGTILRRTPGVFHQTLPTLHEGAIVLDRPIACLFVIPE
ncbi:hypothetical protein NDU88_002795 [Pleurodeles waltl]|uniref:Uncharacterized protein n=1 Tax=Pleurodeles waltl TaxID=8319 RepID=A0AAV7QDR2_PLEWA|nr:hypothetical protein NDU88_002795 [Pleurodeles waltl]